MTDDALLPFDLPAVARAAVIDNGVRQAAGTAAPAFHRSSGPLLRAIDVAARPEGCTLRRLAL
jgi:hypothetical protein